MADTRVALDAKQALKAIDWLKATYPELSEDADLLAATIEGETDFHRIASRLTDAYLDASMMGKAITERKSDLTERGQRYERKAEASKTLLHLLMDAAGERALRLPEATVSISKGRQKVIVTDLEELPQGFFNRVPKITAIADSIDAGTPVPGARIEAGRPILTVRKK